MAGAGRETFRDPRKNIPKIIEKGLRAQLAMQSFITGQLAIQLDLYPDKPAVLKNISKDYIEIPTIPSTGERLAQALGDMDLKGIEKHLLSTLAAVDRFMNNPDLSASIRALKDTLQDTGKLVTRVDRQVNPVADDLKKTVKDIGKLADNVNAQVGGLAAGFNKTMASAQGALSAESPLMVELENMLKEISAMSKSIRQLANILDQHPEALIRGKGNPGGK
jgi:paraquat-inducible protein B